MRVLLLEELAGAAAVMEVRLPRWQILSLAEEWPCLLQALITEDLMAAVSVFKMVANGYKQHEKSSNGRLKKQ